MKKLLTHFELTTPYKFEINDVRALLSLLNLWSIVTKNETLIFVCVLKLIVIVVLRIMVFKDGIGHRSKYFKRK